MAVTVLETPCREWQGHRDRDGYGRASRAVGASSKRFPGRLLSRQVMVHRYVWTLMNGPIPDGLCVCHHCDNPPCFRLDHLFLGTARENIVDRDAKGRTSRALRQKAKTHCPQGHPYDEANTYVEMRPSGPARHCRTCRGMRML